MQAIRLVAVRIPGRAICSAFSDGLATDVRNWRFLVAIIVAFCRAGSEDQS